MATTRKSWGGGGFEATTRKSRNPQPFNPTSRNVKNNKPRSTSGQDKPSSEDDDAASTALRIAMSVKDDKDKYDEKTLADAISIGMGSIKAKMEEFKKDISEDIFFRFLAKLSIENYEDDFDFYYRYFYAEFLLNIMSNLQGGRCSRLQRPWHLLHPCRIRSGRP